MNKYRKASLVLMYLEELDCRTAVSLLNPLLEDDDLAQLYDQLKDEGLF